VHALLRPRRLAPALIAVGLVSAGCGGNDGKNDSAARATVRGSAPAVKAPAPAAKGDIAAID
jgi:hypothetical protein